MRGLLFGFLFLLPVASIAQGSYQFGVLPSLNLNKGLGYDWRLNIKVESRQALSEGVFNEASDFNYNYILSDFSVVTSKKIGINKSIAAGYLVRSREGKFFHRAIQQYAIVKNYSRFRLAHRYATDQTFAEAENAEFRFRYRVSTEVALKGESVDFKEFYFKINNEYLNSFQSTDYDLEIRLIPLIGYKFLDSNKLEWGLDYRLSSFLTDKPKNRLWIAINWFIAI